MVIGPDGPQLEFYDTNQKVRLILGVFRDTPNLSLKNANEQGIATLAVLPTGPGLVLHDMEGNLRAQLDVAKEGPRLFLEDEKGYSTTVGSYYSPEYPGRKLTAAAVILSQKDLGVLWHTP
jgi:hypothetical protein